MMMAVATPMDRMEGLAALTPPHLVYLLGLEVAVRHGAQQGQHGMIAFVGHVHFARGIWVGVRLERRWGRSDGSVDGQRYFDAKKDHGDFFRPTTCNIVEWNISVAQAMKSQRAFLDSQTT